MGGSKPWPQVPVTNDDRTSAAVVIVGAGMGGMCTAIDLIRNHNCHNFIILEKGSNFGGTWLDNKYPGCCCDVRSILYSYSFEPNSQWTREYPGQEEMLDYLISVAQKWHLFKYVRFNSHVNAATWDDTTQQWNIDVTVTGGKEREYTNKYTISSDFMVSAIGQLNNPSVPDFPGMDTFEGVKMHSARWNWNYDLRGKKFGVIGSGATAVQVVPEVASRVDHLTVYQRSPSWVISRLDADVPQWRRTLFHYLPFIQSRIRASMMDLRESFWDLFTDQEGSQWTEVMRNDTKTKLQEAFPSESEHDTHMRDVLTPNYSLGCKRLLVSDDWYPALARDNVTLETGTITRLDENGPVVKDSETGQEKTISDSERLDMLVFATGFQTMKFLSPISITGRGGRKLEDIWKDGPHALNGVTVPDLPNFGMLYGPNTNLGHSSIVLMLEAQSRYINGLIGAVLDARKDARNAGALPNAVSNDPTNAPTPLSLVPKTDVVKTYEEEMQQRLSTSAWADPGCNSWYKDPNTGKITNNWPGDCREYAKRLSRVHWEDYDGGEEVREMRRGEDKAHVGRVREETYVSDRAVMVLGAVSAMLGTVGTVGWFLRGRRLV